MLIVTSLAVALLASPAAGATASVIQPSPPIIVTFSTAATISPRVLALALDEAGEIWRASGFTFVWRRAPREAVPDARSGAVGPPVASGLRVIFGNETGVSRDDTTPLGWISFDDDQTPMPEIYISYENARRLMEAARGTMGMVWEMTGAQRDLLLGRAMGRALAHEMGHYLLKSKIHTARGLMRASRSAQEFFSTDQRGFRIDPAQRLTIAARLAQGLAGRQPAGPS
jgi:hypothetical protein